MYPRCISMQGGREVEGAKIIGQLKKNKLLILLIIVIQGRKHAEDLPRRHCDSAPVGARQDHEPLPLY
jgi:hypothetical protein